ncbi:obscurin-like [Tachysurus ichikawai]
MDLFEWKKKTYLLIVDYLSRYMEVAHLNITSAEVTVKAVKEASDAAVKASYLIASEIALASNRTVRGSS